LSRIGRLYTELFVALSGLEPIIFLSSIPRLGEYLGPEASIVQPTNSSWTRQCSDHPVLEIALKQRFDLLGGSRCDVEGREATKAGGQH
jgi:hypothetical protein